jgi:hypothetical protein
MAKKFKLLIVFILLFLFAVYFYVFDPQSNSSSFFQYFFYIISPFCAVFGGLYALSQYTVKNKKGLAIFFITLGLVCFLIGDIIWMIYDYFLNISPFPSIADVFYLLAYPFFLIGIIKYIKIIQFEFQSSCKILFTILAVSLGILCLFFMNFIYFDTDAVLIAKIFFILKAIGNTLLLLSGLVVVLIVMEFKQGKLYLPWMIFLIAIVLNLLGDILNTFFEKQYFNQDVFYYAITDLIWIASYYLFGYSMFLKGFIVKEINEKISAQKY